MADYSDFMSMGTTYEYSKGPKSLYYAKGDEDLFALVLNVPQQDDDDEWGGTERIALERVADEIGTLQEYVLDPGGGGDGLVDKVSDLESIVDTTTPKVTLGNIVINGSTNTLTIGSDAVLDAETLQLGGTGAFSIDEFSANRYDIVFKNDAIRLFDDSLTPTVTIVVGSSSYIFSETALSVASLSITGDLTVTGDLSATNLTLTGDIIGVKDIGTTGSYMESLYVDEVNCTTLCGTVVKTGNISPLYSGVPYDLGTFSIGAPGNRYNILAAKDINLGDTVTAMFTVDGTTGDVASSGDISGANLTLTGDITGVKDIGTTGSYMESLYVDEVNCSTLCGTIVKTGNISPLYTVTPYDLGDFNIGAPANRYNILVAKDINLGDTVTAMFTVDGTTGDVNVTGDITSTSTGDIRSVAFTTYTSTITGWTTGTASLHYKKVGKTVTVYFYVTGTSNSADATFTLPVTADATGPTQVTAISVNDNSATPNAAPGVALINPAGSTTICYCGVDFTTPGGFQTSGTKRIIGTITYEAA